MPDAESLPALVKSMRKQLGLSQEGLAREIGVSFSSISRWESGKTVPMPLQRSQLNRFCTKMCKKGLLDLSAFNFDS
ncbi:helix-turn-helix domain-containing protein [Ruficoccus sp. ZRK36]|nr:helix-turn-helix domain-containing protein [Ruficoccus sp. ZRK36]